MKRQHASIRGDDSNGSAAGSDGRRHPVRLLALVVPVLAWVLLAGPANAGAATVSVQAYDLQTDADLPEFTYLINEDNAHDPADPDPLQRPGLAPTASNSPVVAKGDETDATSPNLPDGRYLISIRSPGHKMWGKHIKLPADAGEVRIGLRETPVPLGRLRVWVFGDEHWVNSAPDSGEEGLGGFHVAIEDQLHDQVTVDYYNDPLCGGDCITEPDGFLEMENLPPGTYFITVTPPEGSDWVQTTTFDGSFMVQAGVEEGSDGSGAPGEALWMDPGERTGYWFGFARPQDFDQPGTGTLSGVARNWVGWPPFDNLIMGDPVADPYVALTDSASDDTVFLGQGDGAGNFSIDNVPAGSYTLSVWDEQLSYIIRFLNVDVGAGEDVDLGDVGVSRWFGWLSGDVYRDTDGDGIRDPGEPAIPNTDLDQRWRDGSIKEETFTDASGHYEYPTAEGGPLGRFFIGEVGFARFASTGPSVHDELDPSQVAPVPQDQGGDLLTNQLVIEGHRSEVDWGKQPYPDGEPGQIVGVVYHGTTRNELDPRFAAHENYEPGIPGVTVLLEGLGPDGEPNTADDPILNDYSTDQWQPATDCDVTDASGNPITDLNPLIGPNCLEVPITGNETKDGAFDGGYAFADMCPLNPDGSSTYPCDDADKVPLVPDDYITHVISPDDANGDPLYQIEREEDVNVDDGVDFIPSIPPPECVGDLHTVVGAPDRSPYNGQDRPLCDKRLVELQVKQNANADFYLFAKNGVEVPGRILGLVADDIYFDRDPQSIWYGEARPVADVPIGIRDYAGRLIMTTKTDVHGAYEALLPSTETYNCPTPQGICPGMYVVVVNDPGDKSDPNLNYNPDYLTAALAWDVWPGQTTQLDTPLDPISGTGCELPLNMPELLQVSQAYVPASASGTGRQITIRGDWFGADAGKVTLRDPRAGQPTATLTEGNGGIVSWADREIVISVPATGSGFAPGPKQLSITNATNNTTTNGITLHVLGAPYNRPVVNVDAPTANPHAIQDAIDAAAPGSILALKLGTYRENVIMHKRVVLQGRGPGGAVGSPEVGGRDPDDPRFHIPGTVIDGRFIQDNEPYWTAKLGSLSWDGNPDVPVGADITVIASDGEFTGGLQRAMIDGLGLATGHGGGAGGIQVNAFGRNLNITNNVLESNGGITAGAIGLGSPYVGDNHNDRVKMSYNRIMGNGGLVRAGGIGIYNGADRYSVDHSIICSNFGVEYGAGISHWGQSWGGRIADNQIYYNDSVDSGAGIAISHETPQPVNNEIVLGETSGGAKIVRNLIEANYSGDDGGGLFIQNALRARVDILSNMIVDNGAADLGGAIMLDDSKNVRIVNDTLANNVSTGSSEGSDGLPHSAGLAAEQNDPLFQAILPASAPVFSNPRALFNDIFWNNQAYTIDGTTVPPTLAPQGFIDFEVHGTPTPQTFTPRYSLLTSDYGPPNQGNIVGQDPLFLTPFVLELAVAGSRLDPQMASVTITGQDPPVGLAGDYHLPTDSPAIDRGVPFSNFPFPPAPASPNGASVLAPGADFDFQPTGQLRTDRTLTPYDLGADEVPAP